MKEYAKPIAVENDTVAEGVFAASGAAEPASNTSAGNSKDYSLKQTNAWDGNKQYDIIFTNNSDKKVDSITVTLKVNGNVTSIGGNVNGTVNGSTATVSFNNWGNGIEANSSTGAIYMAVTGTGEFSLE